MESKRRLKVSALAEGLSATSLALSVVTVASPYWGRFSNEESSSSGDRVTGYFGLWTVCKDLAQGRSFCGLNITAFNLSTYTFIAGVIAIASVIAVGAATLIGVCLLMMIKTGERVCLPYRPSVVTRLVLAVVAVLLSTVAIATASILPVSHLPYSLYRGWTFYLQMLVIALELALTLVSTYDFVLSRRLGGDPTFYSRDPSGSGALTYSNPSFKDDAGRAVSSARPTNGSSSITSLNSTVSSSSIRSSNGKHVPGSRLQLARQISAQNKSPSSGRTSPHRNRPSSGRFNSNGTQRSSIRGSQRRGGSSSKPKPGIAVTASSGLPYEMSADGRSSDSVDQGSVSSILNGSFGSIESSSYGTTSSIISSSSVCSNPMALSPRKSSLKKPRPRNEVPASPLPEGSESGSVLGFPNPGFGDSRTGSIKRVRIASQSTDV